MSSIHNTLRQYVSMLNLHVRGKKVKALEIIEDMLFNNEPPPLSDADIYLIMYGFEGKKGILRAVGGENHLRRSLKKSSHYAL